MRALQHELTLLPAVVARRRRCHRHHARTRPPHRCHFRQLLCLFFEREGEARLLELEALFRQFDEADGASDGKLHYNEYVKLVATVNDRIAAGPAGRPGSPGGGGGGGGSQAPHPGSPGGGGSVDGRGGGMGGLWADPEGARLVPGREVFRFFKRLHRAGVSGGDYLDDPELFAVTLFRGDHFAVMAPAPDGDAASNLSLPGSAAGRRA